MLGLIYDIKLEYKLGTEDNEVDNIGIMIEHGAYDTFCFYVADKTSYRIFLKEGSDDKHGFIRYRDTEIQTWR